MDERNAGAGGKVVDAHLCPGEAEHLVQLDAAFVTDAGLCVINHSSSFLREPICLAGISRLGYISRDIACESEYALICNYVLFCETGAIKKEGLP